MAKKKTWREKLADSKDLPKVVDNLRGGGTLLIPNPLDVDALMRKVPKGKLVTLDQIMRRLAKEYGGDIACPLVTGIFLRIAAEAAEEDSSRGVSEITPYWRVVKADGKLNEKFPGGIEAQPPTWKKKGTLLNQARAKSHPR